MTYIAEIFRCIVCRREFTDQDALDRHVCGEPESMDKVTEEMLNAGIMAYHENGHLSNGERFEAIYLAMHSKAVGEDEVERVRDAILEAMDVQDGLVVEAAEKYARAAISAMGDRESA